MVDWGLAAKIGGIGFLTVFVVLGILSLVLTIISSLTYKVLGKKNKKEAETE